MKCLTIELRISFSYECYLTLCGQNTCYYMQASRSHPCRKPKCHRNPPAGFSAQLPAPPPPLLPGRKTLSRTLSAGPYSTDKEHYFAARRRPAGFRTGTIPRKNNGSSACSPDATSWRPDRSRRRFRAVCAVWVRTPTGNARR